MAGLSGPATLYVCVCTLLKGQYTYTYVCKLIVITVIMVCTAGLPTNPILANSVEAFNLQKRATQSHTRSDVLFKHQQFEKGVAFYFTIADKEQTFQCDVDDLWEDIFCGW